MAPQVNSIHVALQGIVAVALLVVGVYGIIWTQTSPSDQVNIINAILRGEDASAASGALNGGDAIKPGMAAQYILMFKTAIPTGQGPSTFDLPTGGTLLGPLAWTPPSNTLSSYEKWYAIFTLSFNFVTGPSGCCPLWFSGPQGNISQPSFYMNGYFDLDAYGGPWTTSIFDVNGPGNYTLHFTNTGAVGNVTARVSMGPSLVNFSRTQPYQYLGIAATAFAIIFAAVARLVYRRKPSSTAIKS